uniref:ADP-ribosylglycohydrolase family protein n=1 Tax=uncultured Clostridium sp. TaxID=59620 RepID=UPI0025F39AA3
VVDCLKSSFMILKSAKSYEDAVKSAIALGNDTDTTSAVVGGLAGILFGFDNIPKRWINKLRDKEKVIELLDKCVKSDRKWYK